LASKPDELNAELEKRVNKFRAEYDPPIPSNATETPPVTSKSGRRGKRGRK
jgi:hypothetical protein